MRRFFKRHVALIIVIAIILVFPIGLSNQAKLNMRMIVTGLAIDKDGDKYAITAQIVKSSPGNESPGQSATIDFIKDSGDTIADALSNLIYKTGKVSAYSHTSFVILSNEIAETEASKCLDIFVRDKIIRNSTMVLFVEDKAEDEIKKTKDLDLSVGIGLQKVFLFKQEESNAIMTTALEFLNASQNYSKTSCASVLKLDDGKKQGDSQSGSFGGESGSSSGASGSSNAGGSSDSSAGAGGSSGSEKEPVTFESNSPVYVFIDGKKVMSISEPDDLFGFMISNSKTKRHQLVVEDFENQRLEGAKISINIKKKDIVKKIRFEDGAPVLDLTINIKNSEISEIVNEIAVLDINDDIYEDIEKAMKKKISKTVSGVFVSTKEKRSDIFSAYEIGYKYHYAKLKHLKLLDEKEFLNKLKLNVMVNICKLEY